MQQTTTQLPSKTSRNFGLDLVRASAALIVVFAHGLMVVGAFHPVVIVPAVMLATLGVEIFFVLSGFLIGKNLIQIAQGEKLALDFWVRRCWRTLPNYYFFLVINVIISTMLVLTPARPFSPEFLFFSQALWYPASTPFFAESWSLAVEEWFYLLAAIAGFLCSRMTHKYRSLTFIALLVTIITLSPILRAFWVFFNQLEWDSGLRKLSFFRFDAIATGVLSAYFCNRYLALLRRRSIKPVLTFSVSFLALAALTYSLLTIVDAIQKNQLLAPVCDIQTAFLGSFALIALSFALALLIPLCTQIPPLTNSIQRTIGQLAQWSYSIYLVHFPLLLIAITLHPTTGSLNSWLDITIALTWFISTIYCARGVYRWIECRYYTPLR